jgi:hypothetical protein
MVGDDPSQWARAANTTTRPRGMVWMTTKIAGRHMSQAIVYLDTSEVRPGRPEELKAAMNDLARFVQANEPQLLAYNVYFTDDGTRMSVLHINPDSAALERNMKVAGPRFPPIGEFIKLLSIDLYGDRMTGWLKDYGRRQRCSAARQCACMTSTPDLLACPCLNFSSGAERSGAETSA